MRLISCYVENFGVLSGYNRTFSDNLNIINESNGFGKTTLATFIFSMFYGMPRANKNIKRNYRKRYMPWHGGNYGGNLVFETEGKQYRIERFFGKTPAQDTFELFDLNVQRKCTIYSENIGQELFGLDSESFERSIYIPQSFNKMTLSTDSIQAKLSNLVEDTNDINNYDSAITALKSKRSVFQQFRGNSGSIDETQSQITKLNIEIEVGEQSKEKLETLIKESEEKKLLIENNNSKLDRIRNEIKAVSRSEVILAHKHELDTLKQTYEGLINKKNKIEHFYPKGLPEKKYMEAANSAAGKLDALENQKHDSAAVNNANSIYDSLKDKFINGTPDEDMLDEYSEKYNQYITAYSKLEETNIVRNDARKLTDNKISFLLLIACSVSFINGIILLYLKSLIPGVIIILFTGILAIVGISKKITKKNISEEKKAGKSDKIEQVELLKNDITSFLKIFYNEPVDSNNFNNLLSKLQRDSTAFVQASKMLRNVWEADQKRELERNELLDTISSIFIPYDINIEYPYVEAVSRINESINLLERLIPAISKCSLDIDRFIQEHEDVKVNTVSDNNVTLSDLYSQEERLIEDNKRLNKELLTNELQKDKLQNVLDNLNLKKDELEYLIQKNKAQIQKCSMLDETIDILKQAKDNLSTQYIGSVQNNFRQYSKELLEGGLGDTLIDPELKIMVDRLGAQRDLEYFSAGYIDAILICMRLSLIDALFKKQIPFVILDDPFVNLDDENTRRAIELIKKISLNKQIIYFACNSSRV